MNQLWLFFGGICSLSLAFFVLSHNLAAGDLARAAPRVDGTFERRTNSVGKNQNALLEVVPRAFTWDRSVPCLEPDPDMKTKAGLRAPVDSGILFLKLLKTGGSTAAGITMRIAKHTAERLHRKYWVCRGRWDHAWAFAMMRHRDRKLSFTWTILRDPDRRSISEFFHFEVSRENKKPNDKNFIRFLNSKRSHRDIYIRRLSLSEVALFDSHGIENVNNILNDYDFIGITERMEETAVALSMLLKVPLGDVLFLNAKEKGRYDDGAHRNQCYLIQPSFISPAVQEYLNGKEWKRMTQYDRILYEAANRSLDLTIENLGREAFEAHLATFRQAQELARTKCLPKDVFPCTSKGERNAKSDCLWSDSGCGYKCLNLIAKELGIDSVQRS